LTDLRELHTCLSRGVCPSHLAHGFDAGSGAEQLKSQVNLLMLSKPSDGLHGYAILAQVTDNTSIALIEVDVYQRVNLLSRAAALRTLIYDRGSGIRRGHRP